MCRHFIYNIFLIDYITLIFLIIISKMYNVVLSMIMSSTTEYSRRKINKFMVSKYDFKYNMTLKLISTK